MSHDPLCWCNSQHPDMKPGLLCPRQAECQCECTTIAKVRADEREQAAQRVAAISSWPDINAQYDDLDRLCRWHAAINAARNQHHPQGDTTP